MGIEMGTVAVAEVGGVVDELATWQSDDAPLQLHPGDVGWAWRVGATDTAAALRVWRRDGGLVAVGMLDGPDVFRMTVVPGAREDHGLAAELVEDLIAPDRGILPAGGASVEAPNGTAVQDGLTARGWELAERWTPLQRDLTGPVDTPAVAVEVVGPGAVAEFTEVLRSAFGSPRFTDDRWRAMAAGPPAGASRSLLARDPSGTAVAAAIVWSAGPSRPGLLEPVGVHPDHRGRGHGKGISLAAAAHLRDLGSSSAQVCTPSALSAAVATYRSAGFAVLAERRDRSRPG